MGFYANTAVSTSPVRRHKSACPISAKMPVNSAIPNIDYGAFSVKDLAQDLSGSLSGAGGIGGLVSVTRNTSSTTETFYPVCDGNGNITDYVDASGSNVAHREYDAYGNTIASSGAVNDFNFWFSSKYYDSEINAYYFGYRYYSSVSGRWLSRDPIEEEAAFRLLAKGMDRRLIATLRSQARTSLYLFVQNDPVRFVDYYGLTGGSSKPSVQCKRRGIPIALHFNGVQLLDAGFNASAVSGVPEREEFTSWTSSILLFGAPSWGGTKRTTTFDYSVARQRISEVGPIPEGSYWINVDEERSIWTSPLSHGPLGSASWGSYSWSLHKESLLHPDPATSARYGFFIHGGSSWGSAGCIDIKDADIRLHEYLKGLCKCYIPIDVEYMISSATWGEYTITWSAFSIP